nr:PREDICTED: uncharacterized protein LOC104236015 [Nicotiana sylvestris]
MVSISPVISSFISLSSLFIGSSHLKLYFSRKEKINLTKVLSGPIRPAPFYFTRAEHRAKRKIVCHCTGTNREYNNRGSRKMWKDRGPGVKILWLWAIGTAGILVASVVRTRMRDMEQLMNSQQQTPQRIDSPVISDNGDTQAANSEDFIREEKV